MAEFTNRISESGTESITSGQFLIPIAVSLASVVFARAITWYLIRCTLL
jgi:hypothetical protein